MNTDVYDFFKTRSSISPPEVTNTQPAGCERGIERRLLTGLGGEDAHEAREEGVDRPQDFGVPAGHARGDAALQGLEVGQDGRGLQHRQQEAEDLQARADVGDVGLGRLLLRRTWRTAATPGQRRTRRV